MLPYLVITGLVLLALVLMGFMFIWYLKRKITRALRKTLVLAWNHAMSQSHPNLKIVEADKILDEALRHLGFSGSLGEKLKAAGARFTDLNAVWKAHKLRNSVVHDLQATPNDKEVDEAMSAYRQALRDLGV